MKPKKIQNCDLQLNWTLILLSSFSNYWLIVYSAINLNHFHTHLQYVLHFLSLIHLECLLILNISNVKSIINIIHLRLIELVAKKLQPSSISMC